MSRKRNKFLEKYNQKQYIMTNSYSDNFIISKKEILTIIALKNKSERILLYELLKHCRLLNSKDNEFFISANF